MRCQINTCVAFFAEPLIIMPCSWAKSQTLLCGAKCCRRRSALIRPCCLIFCKVFPLLGQFNNLGGGPRSRPWRNFFRLMLFSSRAWEFSDLVIKNVNRCEVTENTEKIWEATLEDVQEGSCVGPMFSVGEVDQFVGTKCWIPTQRFEVVQKNKVRGVDSATVNGVNMATVVTEKIELPSTDVNVAALRWLRSHTVEGSNIQGWVLDERKAYRQIAVRPDQRKWSVIALRQPSSGKVAFFVMIGHSFGLVAAVYNYNRRSAAITDILRRLFFVAAFNFYDDKYGFEPEATCSSAFEVSQKVHWWLGAQFDPKKLQLCFDPTILGVTYDLKAMHLKIKPSRKEELLDEIDAILNSQVFPPGQAGKLRGKLMFGASQLWGKIGRAFLRSLSERQYTRSNQTTLNKAIVLSLEHWRWLIVEGPPRPILETNPRSADYVLFTDGSFPDGKSGSPLKPWIGGVLFKKGEVPLQFGCEVKQSLIKKWIPRKSQIAMVELFATVVALKTFEAQLEGSWSLLLVDSEPVQGALVKGYSAREDVRELVGVFWKFALDLKVNLYVDRVSDGRQSGWSSVTRSNVHRRISWMEDDRSGLPFSLNGVGHYQQILLVLLLGKRLIELMHCWFIFDWWFRFCLADLPDLQKFHFELMHCSLDFHFVIWHYPGWSASCQILYPKSAHVSRGQKQRSVALGGEHVITCVLQELDWFHLSSVWFGWDKWVNR